MERIQTLSPQVANLIAAGEVVDRPASVIKELLENAIDAGATRVFVEVEGGGVKLLQVTDNGCGMSPRDAVACFGRHATSKVREAADLAAVSTLGFRGEALASVAAVSRVTLCTREPDSDEGFEVVIEGGKLLSTSPCGCPVGTQIAVRDLFFNTPARKKFLKKESTEAAVIGGLLEKLALSRPSLSLSYKKDGRDSLRTAGTGELKKTVGAVLGEALAKELLPISFSQGGVCVYGLCGTPEAARPNRQNQIFFVGGRYVRSRVLQVSLEEAYHGSLPGGRCPVCVLFVDVHPSRVDANVHPQKMEVKFADERAVYDCVLAAVTQTLAQRRQPPAVRVPASQQRNFSAASPEKSLCLAQTPPSAGPAREAFSPGLPLSPLPAPPLVDAGRGKTSLCAEAAAPGRPAPLFGAPPSSVVGGLAQSLTLATPLRRRGGVDVEAADWQYYGDRATALRAGAQKALPQSDADAHLSAAAADSSHTDTNLKIADTPACAARRPASKQPPSPGTAQAPLARNSLDEPAPRPCPEERAACTDMLPAAHGVPVQPPAERLELAAGAAPDPLPAPNPALLSNLSLEGDAPLQQELAMQSFRFVGELFRTYLVAEFEQELWLVDKHAARERILYEQFKVQNRVEQQLLLTPLALEPGRVAVALLDDFAQPLSEAGFLAEPFGESTLLLRAAPMGVPLKHCADLLLELLGLLEQGRRHAATQIFDEMLHRVACAAAVKGGDKEPPLAGEALVRELLRLPNVRYCPHGRPCVKVVPRRYLEKEFLRG